MGACNGLIIFRIIFMEKEQQIISTEDIVETLDSYLAKYTYDRLFVLVDETTKEKCWPLIADMKRLKNAHLIVIQPTDTHKDICSLGHVWDELQQHGATRHSMMVNLGGGMVTDLGGFAASTFKRGIQFINIPTTLLAMVDASTGGKTGINWGGLKNEIGVFNNAQEVIIATEFLKTLDQENMCSGYAEMIKHGIISNEEMLSELFTFDIHEPDLKKLDKMILLSVGFKSKITNIDPLEQNVRKALNFGHTFGHAFESFAMRRQPILHGYAVAYGMICELYLSVIKEGFPESIFRNTVNYIHLHYGKMDISCDDYAELIELMTHDKKNTGDTINFTLVSNVGELCLNSTATRAQLIEALDFYRDGQ